MKVRLAIDVTEAQADMLLRYAIRHGHDLPIYNLETVSRAAQKRAITFALEHMVMAQITPPSAIQDEEE